MCNVLNTQKKKMVRANSMPLGACRCRNCQPTCRPRLHHGRKVDIHHRLDASMSFFLFRCSKLVRLCASTVPWRTVRSDLARAPSRRRLAGGGPPAAPLVWSDGWLEMLHEENRGGLLWWSVVVSTLLTTRYVPRIKNHVGAGILPTWSLQAHGVYWQLYDSLCKLELELELGVGLGRGGGGGGDGGLNGYGRRRGEGGERGEGGDGGGGLNGHDDEEEAPTWQAGQNDVQPTEANEEIKAARTGWVTYELAKAWHARYPDHTRTARSVRRIKSALVSYRWERIRSLGCISSHTTVYVNVNVNVTCRLGGLGLLT